MKQEAAPTLHQLIMGTTVLEIVSDVCPALPISPTAQVRIYETTVNYGQIRKCQGDLSMIIICHSDEENAF